MPRTEDRSLAGGFVWDGTEVHHCDSVQVRTERDGNEIPRRIAVELTGHGRRWRFIGETGITVPLRHRKADPSGAELMTRILESQVR